MVYVDSTLYEVTDAGGTVNVVAEQFVSLAWSAKHPNQSPGINLGFFLLLNISQPKT